MEHHAAMNLANHVALAEAPAGISAPPLSVQPVVQISLDVLYAQWHHAGAGERQVLGLDSMVPIISQHGVIQPLRVAMTPGGYEVLFGWRRALAARMAGLKKVPCIVSPPVARDELWREMLPSMIAQDPTPIDVARALMMMASHHGYLETTRLSNRSRPWVSRHAAVARMPLPVLNAIETGVIESATGAHDILALHRAAPDRAAPVLAGEHGMRLNGRAASALRKQLSNPSRILTPMPSTQSAAKVKSSPEPARTSREPARPVAGEHVTNAMRRIAQKELAAFGSLGTTFDRLRPHQVQDCTRRFLTLMENPCLSDSVRLQSLKVLLREVQEWAH